MRKLVFICIYLSLTIPCAAGTIYVSAGAVGANNGSDWADAYNYLQDALTQAQYDDNIWVAEGTYYPDPNGLADPREAAFQMINDVAIYGGFPTGGSDFVNRDPNQYETILSGDIGVAVASNDNCYHVFFHPDGYALDPNAILDGFTITAGNADAPYPSVHRVGAGMYNIESSPTVINCTFSANYAHDGGGMYNENNSNPTLTNCTFNQNSSGWNGGGMANIDKSSPVLIDCTFSQNLAINCGGGMDNYFKSSPILTECIFVDNSGNDEGGGIHSSLDCNLILTNCIFSGNSSRAGGGIFSEVYSNPTLINCSFISNLATFLGGGMVNNEDSNSKLTNCIFWGNIASLDGNEIALRNGSTIDVDYCDVQGGLAGIYDDGFDDTINWGAGNIDADPMFFAGDDLHLLPGSPCIDAGDPNYEPEPNETDLDGNPRIINAVVDMGAYETPLPPLEAQMKLTPQTLNCSSNGNWIKAHFILPEETTVEDVDLDTPAVIDTLGITSIRLHVFITDDGFVAVNAVFDRAEVCGSIPHGDVELTVTGLLISGQTFYGTDTIRVTTNKFQQFLDFSAYWLQTNCLEPDFCNGFDLDHNGLVNLADFALLAEN